MKIICAKLTTQIFWHLNKFQNAEQYLRLNQRDQMRPDQPFQTDPTRSLHLPLIQLRVNKSKSVFVAQSNSKFVHLCNSVFVQFCKCASLYLSPLQLGVNTSNSVFVARCNSAFSNDVIQFHPALYLFLFFVLNNKI